MYEQSQEEILIPTINQLIKKGRHSKTTKSDSPVLNYVYNDMKKKMNYNPTPQMRDVATHVGIITPKKPNSALCKYAHIRLSNLIEVAAYIPGIGRNLQEYSIILIRGDRMEDLPGVHYHIIRSTLDTVGVDGRKQGRSKYGARKG